MLLYRNTPTVVIGRNQNPWLEADPDYLQNNGIELVRRYSGGGAVYHDLGNTNYSYMMPREDFDRDTTAKTIVSGLQALGLDVALNARHDITIKEGDRYKKCSGSAYKITKDKAYAHGTMLLQSNLAGLGPALRPPESGIQGNGVESVRSEVANIGLHHNVFCDAVAAAFGFDIQHVPESEMLALSEVEQSASELKRIEWKYHQTPRFTQTLTFSEDVAVVATVKQGRYAQFEGPDHLVAELQSLNGHLFEPRLLNSTLTRGFVPSGVS